MFWYLCVWLEFLFLSKLILLFLLIILRRLALESKLHFRSWKSIRFDALCNLILFILRLLRIPFSWIQLISINIITRTLCCYSSILRVSFELKDVFCWHCTSYHVIGHHFRIIPILAILNSMVSSVWSIITYHIWVLINFLD